MSDHSIKSTPPRHNGEGGRDLLVFGGHSKAWLHTQGEGAVLNDDFMTKLLQKEYDQAALTATKALGPTGSDDEKKHITHFPR